MASEPNSFAQSALAAFAVYLLVCGLSAIFLPTSWLWCAGLTTVVSPELGLVFSVLGSYLIALSIGAWLASRSPSGSQGLMLVMLVSQVLDFFTTLRAVYNGSLPRLPGTAFLVITVVWCTVLSIAWRTTRSSS